VQELGTEDLITPTDMVVTLSHTGYIKSQPLAEYRAQKRGGRGKQATQTKEDDWIDQLFIANTHDWILCFSNRGRVYWLKVWEVPQGSRQPRQAHRQHVPAAAGREDHRGAAADR
jgi:DNA gyrase subunit A